MFKRIPLSICCLLIITLGFSQETFLKFFGSPNEDEQVANFIPDGDGNFLITSTSDDKVILRNVSSDGSINWTEAFSIDDVGAFYISDFIYLEDENAIICIATISDGTPEVRPLIFKYAIALNEVQWKLSNDDRLRLYSINHPEDTDFCIITGAYSNPTERKQLRWILY